MVFLAAVLFGGSASAALITDPDSGLVLDTAPTYFWQQQLDHPCVIGRPDCKNKSGFPLTIVADTGGAGTEFNDISSPMYFLSIGDGPNSIESVIGSTAFFIGLDYNDSSRNQRLDYFKVDYWNGDVFLSSQIFDIVTSLKTIKNGTGFSDFTLMGFVVPGGTTKVQFWADWFGNDGPDSYFLIPTDEPGQVPAPGVLALLGIGVAALGLSVRRRRTV